MSIRSMLGLPVKQGILREAAVAAAWPRYGSPSERAVRSLLKKFFVMKEVSWIMSRYMLLDGDELHFSDVRQAKKFVKRLKRLGVNSYFLRNQRQRVFLPAFGGYCGYSTVDSLYICPKCVRLNGPVFREEDGTKCRLDRTPVVGLDTLKPKEIERYVKKAERQAGSSEDDGLVEDLRMASDF